MKNNFSTKLFFAICMALIPFFSSCNKDSENNGNAKGNGECYVDGKKHPIPICLHIQRQRQ